MGNMKFRGLSTKDLDLIIQYKPDYSFPQKDITVEHIPGRNGDLLIDNGSWQNVERTYSIVSVFRPGTDFVSNSEKLIKWLTAKSGYFRLEDSYDPHVYRIASYRSSGTLPNLYDEATVLNVTFDCKPQRYLKNGEKEQMFESSVAILENPTGYTALPDIKITGLINSEDDVLMVSIGTTEDGESFKEVSSSITISKLPASTNSISIISEEQTCYSNQNENVNSSINLNNTRFPQLKSGKTMISVKKYQEKTTLLESYDKKIEANQEICYVKYLPYNDQVKMKAISTLVKSWNLLKQQIEEVYDAESYATYCMKKAETYTFESYNNILAKNCLSYTIRPTDLSDLPSWLNVSSINDNNATISLSSNLNILGSDVSNTKAFIYLNSGSIKLYNAGDELITIKDSSSIVVTLYPCMKNEDKIAVGYDDLPDWLEFNPIMSNNEITKIEFKTKGQDTDTGKGGFYYLPKSGLFGKAQWKKIINEPEVLTTLNWRAISKAFMPEGLSVSKTATFTYYYLPFPYDENNTYLQYEPVMQYKLDSEGNVVLDGNGNKVPEVSNDVNFIVAPNDDLSEVNITPKIDAYYRTDEDELNNFKDNPQFIFQNKSSKSSFVIYTIRKNNFPSYKVIENWPNKYLEPIPVNSSGVTVGINDGTINFKVIKRAWYRIIYTDANNDEKNTPWVLKNTNSILIVDNPSIIYPENPGWPDGYAIKDSDNVTIQYIDAIEGSKEFPIKQYQYTFTVDGVEKSVPDVAFFNKNNELYLDNQPPEWLEVQVIKGDNDDYTDCTLSFKAKTVSGVDDPLYKWDAKTIWTLKSALSEDNLTDSYRTDDTTIYYLAQLPTYSDQELDGKYIVDINQNSTTGDPEEIVVKSNVAAYYKKNNSSYWSFKNINDVIGSYKRSESITIDNLEEGSSLNNITITVIPRWWSL